MDNKTLEIFITVVEEGSILKASKKLFYTRQIISRTLANLEEELGGELFKRNGRGIVPTEYCRSVYERLKYLSFSLEEIKNIYLKEEDIQNNLRIASCYSVPIVDMIINTFTSFREGNSKYNYVSCHSDEVLNMLIENECDIGVFAYEQQQKNRVFEVMEEHNLVSNHLLTTRPAVCVNKNHPLSNKAFVVTKDLEKYHRVEPNMHNETVINHRPYLKRINVDENPKVVISSIADLIPFVQNSDYYFFGLDIPSERKYWDSIDVLPLIDVEATADFLWACSKDYLITKEAEFFICQLERLFKEGDNED